MHACMRAPTRARTDGEAAVGDGDQCGRACTHARASPEPCQALDPEPHARACAQAEKRLSEMVVAGMQTLLQTLNPEPAGAQAQKRLSEMVVASALAARIDRPEPCQALNLSPTPARAQAEKRLSEMVVAGALAARIDRPAGVVRFLQRRSPAELLNGWARSIGRLLDIVEKATQNIQKESMVRACRLGWQHAHGPSS